MSDAEGARPNGAWGDRGRGGARAAALRSLVAATPTPTPTPTMALALAATSLALAGLAACDRSPSPPEASWPRIRDFSASDREVDRGAWTRLSWHTEGAVEVRLVDSRDVEVPSATAPVGAVSVRIDADETFLLRARGATGAVQAASLSVRVRSAAPDDGVFFGVSPSAIEPGATATLFWRAPREAGLSLSADPPSALSLPSSSLQDEGSVAVSPLEDARYTLSGPGWTRTVGLDVLPGAIEFAATPPSAVPGGVVTLRWRVAGARSLELWSPERGRLHADEDLAGVVDARFVDPVPAEIDRSGLLVYELRLSDGEHRHVRSLSVPVEGRPRILEFHVPELARAGRAIALRWLTEETDEVQLEANGRPVPLDGLVRPDAGAPAAAVGRGGVELTQRWSLELPTPSTATTFRLTARHARGGQTVEERSTTVVGAPTLRAEVSPAALQGGELAAISWRGSSLRSVVVASSVDGIVHRLSGAASEAGTVAVRPNRHTRYVVEAGNGLGELVRQELQVEVERPVPLWASASGALRAGQTLALTWALDGGAIVGLPHGEVDVRAESRGFEDIEALGTPVPFGARSATLETDFRAHLFGRLVGERVTVSARGYLSFSPWVNEGAERGVRLPTATLEPLSVVAFWPDGRAAPAKMSWLVKEASTDGLLGGRRLIVQWNLQDAEGTAFQAKVHESGQVDLEYRSIAPGSRGFAGVQGPHPRWGYAAPSEPGSGLGFTFFGPRRAPVSVAPVVEGRWSGLVSVADGAPPLRLEHAFDVVLRRGDVAISEVLAVPAAAEVGRAGGAWVELANALDVPVSLAGWTLELPGGRALPLVGTLPPRGTALVSAAPVAVVDGSSAETWIDEAFALEADGGTLVLARAGPLDVVDYSRGAPGDSEVFDVGPFRASSDWTSGGVVGRALTCRRRSPQGTTGASAPSDRTGPSPGRADGCGFGYALARIEPDFVDLSDAGAVLLRGPFDNAVRELDLSARPFPFFGAPRRSARVSANGFVSFQERINAHDILNTRRPSQSDANLLVAAFADDLAGWSSSGESSVRWARLPGARGRPAFWAIQWSHVTHVGASDDLTFQVKLFDDGAVEVHFAELRSSTSAHYGAGSAANTWLENEAGTWALVVNSGALDPGLASHSAVRFTPVGHASGR